MINRRIEIIFSDGSKLETVEPIKSMDIRNNICMFYSRENSTGLFLAAIPVERLKAIITVEN